MTRAAGRFGYAVEIVRNSDVMIEVGGVGCLLRYPTPERRAASGRPSFTRRIGGRVES